MSKNLPPATFSRIMLRKLFTCGALFFLKKAPHTPAKKRLESRVPTSAEVGLGLCPKYPPLFEKSGQKLLNLTFSTRLAPAEKRGLSAANAYIYKLRCNLCTDYEKFMLFLKKFKKLLEIYLAICYNKNTGQVCACLRIMNVTCCKTR